MSEQIPTPYFLIQEGLLAQNVAGFRQALDAIWPNSIIAYSVKTNALPWILGWMNQHGVYAEVVSDEEYALAELSGYKGKRIVFNGPIKSDAYLQKALDAGAIVNIDSEHELRCLEKARPHVAGYLGVRVNMGSELFDPADVGYQQDGFRFGFADENGQLEAALNRIQAACGNVPVGIHMHVNSVTRAPAVYAAIARYAARIIEKHQLTPVFIDIGGGFFGGVPGKTTPEEYIETIAAELRDHVDPDQTKLIIEPGSAAIGSAIELHTTVLDVKDTAHARIVTTDGSRIHIDPLWAKKGYLHTTDAQANPHPRQVICGYTCMDHDRLMVLEGEPELAVGDHIVYHRVGNYTTTFGGPFIRPYPAVYVQKDGHVELARKAMTVEQYYQLEAQR